MEEIDALVEAARAGGGWAFARLWERLAPAVAAYLQARGVRDADDATSEVFLAAFLAIARFDGGGDAFRAWVFTIAHHKQVDARRRDSAARETLVGSVPDDVGQVPSAEQHALQRIRDDDAVRLLASLSEDQRDVLLLRVVADLSLAETATALGKPVGAVKALQHRGLSRLRKTLAKGVSPGEPHTMATVR